LLPIKTDCRHFRGGVPCTPHKQFGVHCVDDQGHDCPHYDRITTRILIIKLGAIGDVIRTTPLLQKLQEVHPSAAVYWLTYTPEILPSSVDVPLDFSLKNIVTLRSIPFDLLFNLDKDPEACALTAQVQAKEKRGFTMTDGTVAPIDEAARAKFETGVFDDVSKANTKSYVQEIFDICGFPFGGEQYQLDNFSGMGFSWKLSKKKPVIGLNTGCGGRWTSRLWAEKNWRALAMSLKKSGYEVVFLGGAQEDSRNRKLAKTTGGKYFGHFPLRQFINLVDQCDLVVTGVTMAMHITIGLGKKIVLFNNIFNKHEFDLYQNGILLEPSRPCQCFYQPTCTNEEYQCMDFLSVQAIADACRSLLKR
jgi:lipopolysaccharide heptosyltransferase III